MPTLEASPPNVSIPIDPNAMPAVGVDPTFEAALAVEETKQSRWHFLGRSVLARGITEVAGIGVDAALMGAGSAVSILEDVAARESVASGVDLAILNKLSPHEESHTKVPPTKLRRIGGFAVTLATAIAAQKFGPGIVDHLHAGLLNQGVGHYAVPLSSKVGATSAVNSMLKRA